jgi:hypothetical protein
MNNTRSLAKVANIDTCRNQTQTIVLHPPNPFSGSQAHLVVAGLHAHTRLAPIPLSTSLSAHCGILLRFANPELRVLLFKLWTLFLTSSPAH